MPKLTLTAAAVAHAVAEAGKRKTDYYDTAVVGFVLEVRETGGKTYWLRYRDGHGTQRQHKIGDAASLPFDQAKATAQTLRARVVLGEDPAAEKAKKRTVPTVAELAVRYLSHVRKAKKSWDIDERHLRNHILPKWGKKHLDELDAAEVTAWLHGLKDAGYAPASANRQVVILRHMLNLAKRWGVAGAEGHPLAHVTLLPVANERERYLSPEETQRLRAALAEDENPQLPHIVALLLMLGCRKRELLDAKWDEFDLEAKRWRIPASKTGVRHVPLSSGALAVLAQLPRWDGCPYVVPNPKTRQPYDNLYRAWNRARTRAGLPDVRMHDLRHSFASFLVNAGESLYTVAKILGHAQLRTTQRYSHLDQSVLLAASEAATVAVGWETAAPAVAARQPSPATV